VSTPIRCALDFQQKTERSPGGVPTALQQNENVTRPTWTNLFYLGAGEMMTRGLGFVAFAYLGRTLLTAQFGTLGSVLAVMMVCTLVVDFGLGILGSREIAKRGAVSEELVARVVSTQLVLALLAVSGLLAASWMLPLEPAMAALLRGFAISLLGVPFLLNWVFQGRNEMFWYATPTVLRWVLFLAVVLAVVHGPEQLAVLPVAEIAGVATAAICFVLAYRRSGARLRLRTGWDLGLLRRCAPIGGSNLIWAVRMYLPVLVVYGVAGAGPAGLFESAHRLVMVFAALLGVYFTNLFPAMSASSAGAGTDFVNLLRRAMSVSLAATLGLCAITFFAAPQMLSTVFGDRYANPASTTVLIILTGLMPVFAARRTGRYALIALERQRAELWCSVAGVILLLALLFALTPSLGIRGSACAMWISEAVATGLTWAALAPRLRAIRSGVENG